MNAHEFESNTEQTTQSTEWDALSEVQMQTAKHEIGPDDAISKLVEEKYGNITDKLIDSFCLDGDDNTDPDNYTASLFLEKFLPFEEQKDIFQSRANGEPIDDKYAQKLKNGIAEVIRNSDLSKEIESDPFFRYRRLDHVAGRTAREEQLPDDARLLIEGLWNTDDAFYDNIGFIVLNDPDFIKKTCDVDKLVEKELAKAPDAGDKQQLEEQYIDLFSNLMQRILGSKKATAKELITDPFLKKKLFDSLLDIFTGKMPPEGPLFEYWNYIDDFPNSPEYGMMLYDKIRDNPDIYDQVDTPEVDKIIDEAIEQIPSKQLAEIARTYENDPREGDKQLISLLLPPLGLSGNPPSIEYIPAENETELGNYNKFQHTIYIREENISRFAEEVHEQPAINRTETAGVTNDSIVERMDTIAHEMWHAHQWYGSNVSNERREKYLKNFTYYIGSGKAYDAYRKQLVEFEAFAFGNKIEELVTGATE